MQHRNPEVLGCSENPQGMVDGEERSWRQQQGAVLSTREVGSSQRSEWGAYPPSGTPG